MKRGIEVGKYLNLEVEVKLYSPKEAIEKLKEFDCENSRKYLNNDELWKRLDENLDKVAILVLDSRFAGAGIICDDEHCYTIEEVEVFSVYELSEKTRLSLFSKNSTCAVTLQRVHDEMIVILLNGIMEYLIKKENSIIVWRAKNKEEALLGERLQYKHLNINIVETQGEVK